MKSKRNIKARNVLAVVKEYLKNTSSEQFKRDIEASRFHVYKGIGKVGALRPVTAPTGRRAKR